jgi:hypothetical protein
LIDLIIEPFLPFNCDKWKASHLEENDNLGDE